jgi:hypothetical protein
MSDRILGNKWVVIWRDGTRGEIPCHAIEVKERQLE